MAIAAWIALAHGMNDAYAAFLPPLLPRIMGNLGLSVALAATLTMTFSVSQSLLQPLAGFATDRYGPRAFVVAGPLMSGVFLSLLGLAPGLGALIALLVLGGLGSALFHPPGAAFAARTHEGKGSGLRFSFFSFGRALGFSMGPLLAVALVSRWGFAGLAWAMVPALIVSPMLWWVLPRGRSDLEAPPPPGPRTVGRLLMGPLGLVFGISAVAAFEQRVFLTFMPLIAAADGRSEALGAVVLSIYLGAQALGTLTGGILTDRMDRRRLLVGLSLLALPAHGLVLALDAGSPWGFAAAAFAGFTNMAMLPPVVILAQELVPAGRGVSSGIVMGLAWGTGALFLPLIGLVGDAVGPRMAALFAVPLFLLATALALHPTLRRAARDTGASRRESDEEPSELRRESDGEPSELRRESDGEPSELRRESAEGPSVDPNGGGR